MGYLPEPTTEMGDYSVEVRRESFRLYGADGCRVPQAELPRSVIYVNYANVTPENFNYTGVAEILIEDIPNIRAALDQVERVVAERDGRRGAIESVSER